MLTHGFDYIVELLLFCVFQLMAIYATSLERNLCILFVCGKQLGYDASDYQLCFEIGFISAFTDITIYILFGVIEKNKGCVSKSTKEFLP